MAGNCDALAETNRIMAEAIARPFPFDSWDSSLGNHSINASTASELPTTESSTPTEGNTTAPTMPKGETSSGINEGISPLHSLHF